MKKIILATLLLAGAGIATSRADVLVEFSSGHHGHGHAYVPARHVYVAPPVVMRPAPVYGYYDSGHAQYHHQLSHEHRAVHHEPRREHESYHHGARGYDDHHHRR